MIACDLDGVFTKYGDRKSVEINTEFVEFLKAQGVTEIAIVTNQGGLCFKGEKYPTVGLGYNTSAGFFNNKVLPEEENIYRR